ncbi:hypothetical protein ACV3RR_04790 [Clostridium perfringens]
MDINLQTLKSISSLLTQKLYSIDVDEILITLYLNPDKEIKHIVNYFEKIIIIAKSYPEKLDSALIEFIAKMKLEFKNNPSALKQYYKFLYKSINYLNGTYVKITDCYFSLAIEVLSQLSNNGDIISAFNNDKPIFLPEVYPGLFKIVNQYTNENLLKDNLLKIGRKYGYNRFNIPDLLERDRILSNQRYIMAGVLDESDLDLYPNRDEIQITNIKPDTRVWMNTEYYVELLKKRNYKLPKDGVLCRFNNFGCIKSIFFKEKMFFDKIVLIFQITNLNDEKSIGLYIPIDDIYIDIYISHSNTNPYNYKNSVLEVYTHLTTNIEITNKKMSAIHISDSLTDIKGSYYLNQPIMQVLKPIKEDNITYVYKDNNKRKFKVYDKSNYIEIIKDIAPFIRKLPEGFTASEEAKLNALKYGYELKDGETFVKPFEKKVKEKNSTK